jgi:hypothetical protein
MKPELSETSFRALLRNRNLSEKRMTGADALSVMIAFYRDQRAKGCDATPQGDMLLFQWGIYGFGRPKTFQFDITRQFIVGTGEDDEIFQLRFTLHYPALEVGTMRSGNRWCETPLQTSDFEEFVRKSEAYRYAGTRLSEEIELSYGCAG